MAATISIITLSLIVAFLCWKLIPLMIELGKYRKEWETHSEPEIKFLRRNEEQLLRDIEKIVEGDRYVTDIWKERIEQRKKRMTLFDTFKQQ